MVNFAITSADLKRAGIAGIAFTSAAGVVTIGYLAYRGLRMLALGEIGQAYDRGQSDGIAYGKRTGRADGKRIGYEAGQREGYMKGYDDAYDDAYLAAIEGKPYLGHTPKLIEEFGPSRSTDTTAESSHDAFDDIMKIFQKRDEEVAVADAFRHQLAEDIDESQRDDPDSASEAAPE